MSKISKDILQRVAQFIAHEQLISAPNHTPQGYGEQPHVFIGLSGGSDSVALLHIMRELGYQCEALHCNFHLRKEESMRDQHFCELLCHELNVPLQVKEFDTRSYMQEHHLSLEMAARNLRYDWWEQILNSHNYRNSRIALGHHQDDSIETLLMNLMRGTGIQGLTGIVSHNAKTHVIRPLLCLSRQDILDYLRDNDLSFVTDSTNAENDTLRNQIRNRLLPLMEQMVPQARTGISNTMAHLQGTAQFASSFLCQFDHLTTHHSFWGIEWDELSLERLHTYFGEDKGAEDYLHDWQQRFCPPRTHQVVRTAKWIYTEPVPSVTGKLQYPELITFITHNQQISSEATDLVQYFDADTIQLPLTLRLWREGDRIAPLGMHGHTKLVSDLFSDAHFSPIRKKNTLLVTDATGAILWIVGLRISEQHKVQPTTTRTLAVTIQ